MKDIYLVKMYDDLNEVECLVGIFDTEEKAIEANDLFSNENVETWIEKTKLNTILVEKVYGWRRSRDLFEERA